MARALMYASVASMIQQFNMENIRLLLEQGYRVDVACNMEQGSTISAEKIAYMQRELEQLGVEVIHIPIPRNITAFKQIFLSLRETLHLMNDRCYDMVHCHSPIGGMICRLANRLSQHYKQTRMLYTAHGFHFYKGAPLKNWMLYYPVEKICSHFTDVLITINQEDYALAQKKLKSKRVEYIPGVGIDTEKFANTQIDKVAKRQELGIPENAILLLSVGELNKNKNHETVIRAIKDLDVYYIIAGKGDLQEHLQSIIDEFGMTERVKLLGFRNDVAELYQVSDIYVLPSIREGLNVSVMEAMASGLPCVVSKIRGNTDLIDEDGGALFEPHSADDCKNAICRVLNGDTFALGKNNIEKANIYSLQNINNEMRVIYSSL